MNCPLLDKLRAQPWHAPWYVDPAKRDVWLLYSERLHEILRNPELPAFNIDCFAHPHYSVSPQEYFDLGDLAPLPASYPVQWLEHALPQQIRSEIGDQDLRGEPELHGHAGFLIFDATRDNVAGEEIPETAARVMVLEIFMEIDQPPKVVGPHGSIMLALDSSGCVIDRPWIQGFHRPEHNEEVRGMQAFIYPALLAISESGVAELKK